MKIADFGLSALVTHGQREYHDATSSRRRDYFGLNEPWGTIEYEAPELVSGQGYGPQVDVWAVGCIVYEMLSGTKAFPRLENEFDFAGLRQRIQTADYRCENS